MSEDKSFDLLSEKERLLLVADVLEFFRRSDKHQGRQKSDLKDDPLFQGYDPVELYALVDSLVDAQQIWRRGDGPKTIYATDEVGVSNIEQYRKQAARL